MHMFSLQCQIPIAEGLSTLQMIKFSTGEQVIKSATKTYSFSNATRTSSSKTSLTKACKRKRKKSHQPWISKFPARMHAQTHERRNERHLVQDFQKRCFHLVRSRSRPHTRIPKERKGRRERVEFMYTLLATPIPPHARKCDDALSAPSKARARESACITKRK